MNQGNQGIWQDTELGRMLTFQRGFDITKNQFKDGQYPVVFSSGIGGNHHEFKVKGPGVVIGRKGSLGTTFYIEKDFWPTDTTLWIKDFHGNDEKFAYYFLQTLHLEKYDCGSSNPTLNRNHIHTIPVKYPPLPIQRKIADILSAYDELIENNTRQIKILEEMAALIYREWFVNFRFPGHEQVKMVDSQLGCIPEGWEVKHLPAMCSKVIDGTHDSPKSVEEGYYLVTGKHITNGFIDFSKCYFISPEEHQKVMKRSRPEKGDILFSNIGTLGSTVLVDQDFEFSIKNIALFKPKQIIYSGFLYLFFSSKEIFEILNKAASGTSQKFFSLKFLRDFKLVEPPDSLIIKFDNIIRPILTQRSLIHQENQNLRKTRDLLLPKLISGEIDLETLNTPEIELWAA